MQAQFPLPPNPQQQKSVNLLQLHALHWLYAQAQQNMSNIQNPCCHAPGQPGPFNCAQQNMNYFVPPQNGPPPQPYNQFNLPAGGVGIKQLYNHAQSAMLNIPPQCGQLQQPPFNIGQHSTSFVPPQFGKMQPPYNYAQLNPYNVAPCGQMQPPHGQFLAQNMAYMPPQCGQMQPPYFQMPQCMNFIPPPCGQVQPPEAPIFNPFRTELNVNAHADNVPGYNVPLANNQSQPHKKHVYVNGALYNAELLEPPIDKFRASEPEYPAQSFLPDMDLEEDDIEDEGYDPLDDTMPTVYGIRFYNPNNGPEGAIPKRFTKSKFNCNANDNAESSLKPPESFLPDIPLYQGVYRHFPLQRMNNIGDYGPQENRMGHDVMACNNNDQQDADQELADAANSAAENYIASMSPNSKAKRRQGRSRSRGFIQSFGIVAPIKRNNQTAKENVAAAKNVLSLFEKPPVKKWDDIDEEKLDINLDWPLPTDGSKFNIPIKSQTKRNTPPKDPNEFSNN